MSDTPDGHDPLCLVNRVRSSVPPDPESAYAPQIASKLLRVLRSGLFSQSLQPGDDPASHFRRQLGQVPFGGFVKVDLVTHRPSLALASERGTFLPPAAIRSRVT